MCVCACLLCALSVCACVFHVLLRVESILILKAKWWRCEKKSDTEPKGARHCDDFSDRTTHQTEPNPTNEGE